MRPEDDVGEGIIYHEDTNTFEDRTSGGRVEIDHEDVSNEIADRYSERNTPEDRPWLRESIRQNKLADLQRADVYRDYYAMQDLKTDLANRAVGAGYVAFGVASVISGRNTLLYGNLKTSIAEIGPAAGVVSGVQVIGIGIAQILTGKHIMDFKDFFITPARDFGDAMQRLRSYQ